MASSLARLFLDQSILSGVRRAEDYSLVVVSDTHVRVGGRSFLVQGVIPAQEMKHFSSQKALGRKRQEKAEEEEARKRKKQALQKRPRRLRGICSFGDHVLPLLEFSVD